MISQTDHGDSDLSTVSKGAKELTDKKNPMSCICTDCLRNEIRFERIFLCAANIQFFYYSHFSKLTTLSTFFFGELQFCSYFQSIVLALQSKKHSPMHCTCNAHCQSRLQRSLTDPCTGVKVCFRVCVIKKHLCKKLIFGRN
jgi:hypothetical protein